MCIWSIKWCLFIVSVWSHLLFYSVTVRLFAEQSKWRKLDCVGGAHVKDTGVSKNLACFTFCSDLHIISWFSLKVIWPKIKKLATYYFSGKNATTFTSGFGLFACANVLSVGAPNCILDSWTSFSCCTTVSSKGHLFMRYKNHKLHYTVLLCLMIIFSALICVCLQDNSKLYRQIFRSWHKEHCSRFWGGFRL